MRRWSWAIGCVIAVCAIVGVAIWTQWPEKSPRIVLWAWERRENLEFINPREIAIAFLAKTIRLRRDETDVKPRFQPLTFAHNTSLIAVFRIESDRIAPPALSGNQVAEIVAAICEPLPPGQTVQIDFDAMVSERTFYRDLLQALRQRLPMQTKLSITALASWCIYDDWLTGLPINEAVPMLFRMGVERDEVLQYLVSGKEFRCQLCRNSMGVSTDEPLPLRLASKSRRIYLFHPRSWSEAEVNNVLREWQ